MAHQTNNIYNDLSWNIINAVNEMTEDAFTYARQAIQIAHNNGYTLGVMKGRKEAVSSKQDTDDFVKRLVDATNKSTEYDRLQKYSTITNINV